MGTPANPFTLASWRREVAELYAGMRNTAQRDPKLAAAQFRAGSDPPGDTMLLDFNFAYNPSCAYDHRWSCPLSPSENKLPLAVKAGERAFAAREG